MNIKISFISIIRNIAFVFSVFPFGYSQDSITISYAKNFIVEEVEGGRLVTVNKPWVGSGDLKFQYLLIDKDSNAKHEKIPGVLTIPTL